MDLDKNYNYNGEYLFIFNNFLLVFFVSIIVYGSGNDGPSCSCRIESKTLSGVVLVAICISVLAIFIYMVETISGQRHPS